MMDSPNEQVFGSNNDDDDLGSHPTGNSTSFAEMSQTTPRQRRPRTVAEAAPSESEVSVRFNATVNDGQRSFFTTVYRPLILSVPSYLWKACTAPQTHCVIDKDTGDHCVNILRLLPTILLGFKILVVNTLKLYQRASRSTEKHALLMLGLVPCVHLLSVPLFAYLCMNRESIYWKRPSSSASLCVTGLLLGWRVIAVWCCYASELSYREEYKKTIEPNILISTVLWMYCLNKGVGHWDSACYFVCFLIALTRLTLIVVWYEPYDSQWQLYLRLFTWLISSVFISQYIEKVSSRLNGTIRRQRSQEADSNGPTIQSSIAGAQHKSTLIFSTNSIWSSLFAVADAFAILPIVYDCEHYSTDQQLSIFYLLLRAVWCLTKSLFHEEGLWWGLWNVLVATVSPLLLGFMDMFCTMSAEYVAHNVMVGTVTNLLRRHRYNHWGLAALTAWLVSIALLLYI